MGSTNPYLSKPLHNFSLPPFSDNLVICKQRSKNRKKTIKDPQETEGSDQPNSDATQTPVSERKQKIVLNLKMRLKNSICEIANHEEPKASGQLNPHKASDVTQRRKTDHHHQPEIIIPTKKNAAALTNKKRRRVSVTLSREEIEEDIAEIAKLAGKKLQRRNPKKRPRINLDHLFPDLQYYGLEQNIIERSGFVFGIALSASGISRKLRLAVWNSLRILSLFLCICHCS
ncbi:hypothetical protein Golax_006862 [Gossypium laxum]|uniref:Uncharacterized protein n=1 Tax=Gossypium laxum TaxID=34288 RepID=A0A7J9A6L4_9ROSI|nr:hypothetical protein [Gossypium laxum]